MPETLPGLRMQGDRIRIVIVTGLSGAGLSSSLKSLEDSGFDVVDNLPIPLFRTLLSATEALKKPLAVGIASRTRGLDPLSFGQEVHALRADPRFEITLLFLNCDDEILRRRFTETRRRHPLANDHPVTDGIARERAMMEPLRLAADIVFDTSATLANELRHWVAVRLGHRPQQPLTVTIVSFAYRNGLPREADLVFDVRFLRNPHYVAGLRPQTGLDTEVQDYVRTDPDFEPFFNRLQALLLPLLPRYVAEGKSYLTVAIGCTGGQHRSVFIALALSRWLDQQGWPTSVIHRELARLSAPAMQAVNPISSLPAGTSQGISR